MEIKSLRAPAPPILLGRSWEAFHMVELVYMIVLTLEVIYEILFIFWSLILMSRSRRRLHI